MGAKSKGLRFCCYNYFAKLRCNECVPRDTTRNIHFYDENFNDDSETVIKIAFYDKNFSFVIDHRDEPRTPLIYDEIGYHHKKCHRTA